jgi:nucleotide-binding universal stress UspA family protein
MILVGVDGTHTSWNALWWACGEAARSAGMIIAAFISAENSIASADVALTVAAVPFDYDVIRSGAAQQATQLEAEVRRQTDGYDVAIEFVHSHRDAANELLSLAKGVRADLIVVGNLRASSTRSWAQSRSGSPPAGRRP